MAKVKRDASAKGILLETPLSMTQQSTGRIQKSEVRSKNSNEKTIRETITNYELSLILDSQSLILDAGFLILISSFCMFRICVFDIGIYLLFMFWILLFEKRNKWQVIKKSEFRNQNSELKN